MIKSSDFIFGCGTIGSRISKKKSYTLFNKALKLNINSFDCSPIYGKGLAEKYLSEYLSEFVIKKKISCTIKYGQHLNCDLKTILINIYRREFLNLIRIFNHKNPDFSLKNLKFTVQKYIFNKKIKYNNFFFHSPKISIQSIKPEIFKFLKSKKLKIGYTSPFVYDPEHLFNDNNFDVIQLSAVEYSKYKNIIKKKFKKFIWINQIIKFSKKHNIDWINYCENIKKEYKKVKFVIGFNHLHMLEKIESRLY
jgi:hypothetical protein